MRVLCEFSHRENEVNSKVRFYHENGRPRSAMKLLRAGVLVLLAASLAIPGRAADDRAIKTKVSPVYPEIAKRMKITGTVRVEATVSPDGKVTAVRVVSGNGMLGAAAADAVSKWRYAPADAESTVEIDLNFALAQ